MTDLPEANLLCATDGGCNRNGGRLRELKVSDLRSENQFSRLKPRISSRQWRAFQADARGDNPAAARRGFT